MRCRHDRSRDLTKDALLGDIRGCVVFRKQSRSSRLSNARVQRRAAWRDPCPARGVTRECVRWNAMLGVGLTSRSLEVNGRCEVHLDDYSVHLCRPIARPSNRGKRRLFERR